MADAAKLRRRYRRLLRAYPRWYRRYRGEEMLTTLLDDARPGQARPSVGEAFDILVGGLQCRLRPPHPGFLIVFVPVSVFVGLLCSVVAIGVTFAVFAPIPTEDEGVTVAELATGQRPSNVPGGALDCPETGCMESWDPAGDQVVMEDRPMYRDDGMDAVVVGYWTPDAEMPAWIAGARARLAAYGWTVHPLDSQTVLLQFTADKGDFEVRVWAWPGVVSAPAAGEPFPIVTPASLTMKHRRPPVNVVSSTAGFLVGPLIGWLFAGWVIRRGREHHGRRNTAVLLWGTAAVLLTVLVDGMTAALGIPFLGENQKPLMMLPTLLTSVEAIFVVPALLAALITLGVAALPTHPRTPQVQPARSSDGRSRGNEGINQAPLT